MSIANFIYLDSKDRYSGTPTNFSIRINDISPNQEKNVSLEGVIIPYSFYNINSYNNSFVVGANTVILENGSYESPEFITEMKTKLDAIGVSTFTVSISSTTNKLKIVADIGDFSITSNEYNCSYLGIESGSSKNSSSGIYESDNPITLIGTRYIDITVSCPISSVNSSNYNMNTLARIYITENAFGYISMDSSAFNFVKLQTDRLNQIDVSLRDEFGNVIDLNGHEWCMSLNIKNS